MMEKHSRVYAEIDLDAISYNMEQMKKRVGEGAKFIAVVKNRRIWTWCGSDCLYAG